jgi:hypothetical protein
LPFARIAAQRPVNSSPSAPANAASASDCANSVSETMSTARADARPDRVDALRVRLDSDLRAVTGLARDAADLDEAVGDLRDLELEQRLDQLRVAAGDDHLRPLRAGAHLGDDGLDA